MKLTIDIKEEVYKSIQDNDYCGISNADMYNAIKNGIPHENVTEFADRCKACGAKYGKLLEQYKALNQEPCEDAVSKSDVMALIERTNLKYLSGFRRGISQKAFDDLLHETIALPPVTPQQKTGHWIKHEHNGIGFIECSECLCCFLESHLLRNSYCPNCGAKMEVEDNG